MRGWVARQGSRDLWLEANDNSPEYHNTNSLGYNSSQLVSFNASNNHYLYIAIRRPNKPYTTPTDLFKAFTQVGSSDQVTNWPVDLAITKTNITGTNNYLVDRARGPRSSMNTDNDNMEFIGWTAGNVLDIDNSKGVGTPYWATTTNDPWTSHCFRRSPGFLDIVPYVGDGSASRSLSHKLGSKPGFMIIKNYSSSAASTSYWRTYHKELGATKTVVLSRNFGVNTLSSIFNNTEPTATNFTVGNNVNVNQYGAHYVAFLFGELDGVTKIGKYNGTSNNNVDVDCGFSALPRYILIRRAEVSQSADWYVFDHANGISAGNDGYWNYNTNGAVNYSNDYIDPHPNGTGFRVTSSAPSDLNQSGGTYIYIAIA